MASFAAGVEVAYSNGTRSGGRQADVTVSDSDPVSTTFTENETLGVFSAGGTSLFSGTFLGTTVVNGHTYVVLSVNTTVRLFGPAADLSTFPSDYDDLTIDTNTFTVCFLAGTIIRTPAGETPVESLAVGDLVLTADGRAAPVKWVGIQTVVSVFADPLRAFPIRITAGALGEGMPARDLFVSPDHALFLDGVLVQAGALINGTTIVRESTMPERFTYFHVELEDHALILAEGVPAETFLDTVTRRRFDHFADDEAHYGDTGPVIAELPAPRVKSARQLPAALRARLAAQEGGRGPAGATVAAA
jgi:hypothetical protein